MLCEKCGKNIATTHIRTVVNGVVREQNLCGYCAANEGYTGLTHNSFAGMLASMLGEITNTRIASQEVKCSVCGAKFSDIAKTGKMGCAECYKTFNSEILPYLKRIHGSTKHSGKIPNRAPLIIKPKEDTIDSLRAELNRLVSEEKYEQAAVVRDKIKKMEGEING